MLVQCRPSKEGRSLSLHFETKETSPVNLRGQHFEVSEEQLVMMLCLKIDWLH